MFIIHIKHFHYHQTVADKLQAMRGTFNVQYQCIVVFTEYPFIHENGVNWVMSWLVNCTFKSLVISKAFTVLV